MSSAEGNSVASAAGEARGISGSARERISILIPAYKTVDLVRRCIDSLVSMFGGHLPELVLVDDAAGDPAMRELAMSYAKYGIKFAVMPQNGGFAGAVNFGWTQCTKEFAVLVNSDIVFHENPFETMVAFMDRHQRAGVIQGTVVIRNGSKDVDGRLNGCGAFLTSLGNNTTVGWLAPADDPVAMEARKCFAAYGAMFMIRRGVVEATGRSVPFYDFFHSYYEEVNFCHRAWLAGWEVWYVPTPPVDHAHGATSGKYFPREDIVKRFYRNIKFSYATCLGLRGRLTVLPMFRLACVIQSIAGLLHGNGMDWRAHRWASKELRSMKSLIAEERRRIQSTRVVSDSELFKAIKRRRTFRDAIAEILKHL